MDNEENIGVLDENDEVIDLAAVPPSGDDAGAIAENGSDAADDDDADMQLEESDSTSLTESPAFPFSAHHRIIDPLTRFPSHTADIFAIDCSPDGHLIVTGGEDDRAYIWTPSNLSNTFSCDGHSDSVTSVRLSRKPSSPLVATGDLSGIVQVWNSHKRARRARFELGADLEWLAWHHAADVLFAGAKDGLVWMWLVPPEGAEGSEVCKVFTAAASGPVSCTAGELFTDGVHLLTGYEDGVIRVWDLKAATNVSLDPVAPPADEEWAPPSVTCVSCFGDNALAAAGFDDGMTSLFHARTGKLVARLTCAGGGGDESVESVCFSAPAQALLCTGALSGELAVWDLHTTTRRQTVDVGGGGVVKMAFSGEYTLIVGCVNGALREFDVRNGECVRTFGGGNEQAILDFCVSEDRRVLVAAGGGGSCQVFQLS